MADAPSTPSGREWLVLVHQLPPGASNARVKIWRRLQAIGAMPLRNAAYVLPNTAQAREDLAWVRQEIQGIKGQATILIADTLEPAERQALVDAFRAARTADFAGLQRDLDRAVRTARRARSAAARPALEKTLRTLRDRLHTIDAIDFFAAPGGQEARDTLHALETQMPRLQDATTAAAQPALDAATFRGKAWVTRPRPGVDRMASAWLIRRYIDPKAQFRFADKPAAGTIPFDMYTGEFSHQGSLCTFEVLVQRFGLTAAALTPIAQIVHDLDMKEVRYNLPEAAAVGRMVEGFRHAHADDAVLLQHGMAMFEALSHSFATAAAPGSPRARKPKR